MELEPDYNSHIHLMKQQSSQKSRKTRTGASHCFLILYKRSVCFEKGHQLDIYPAVTSPKMLKCYSQYNQILKIEIVKYFIIAMVKTQITKSFKTTEVLRQNPNLTFALLPLVIFSHDAMLTDHKYVKYSRPKKCYAC